MAKTKRQRDKASQRRSRKRKASQSPEVTTTPDASTNGAFAPQAPEVGTPTLLAGAIRTVGIAPIALLVAALSLHELYPGPIPRWLEPIVDKQTAVLTLSAGHAGIIGLLISTKGRFTPSTYALLIAAVATALAGFRTIGDSTAGQAVAATLALLTIPAVWSEFLSTLPMRVWYFARSPKGILVILFVTSVMSVAYNQSLNENYIRDWMLIPFGVLTGIVVASYLVWILAKLIYRFAPVLFSGINSAGSIVYRRVPRRGGNSES